MFPCDGSMNPPEDAMSKKFLIPLALLALAVALFAGCTMPDYVLEYDQITVSSGTSYPVTVSCRLYNSGYKPIYGAMVRVDVQATLVAGGMTSGSEWTPGVDLDIGEQRYVSTTIYPSSSGPYSLVGASIGAVGWDSEDDVWE
mgnify:CR=1 FL=1